MTMKMIHLKRTVSFIVCMVLIAAIALSASGCDRGPGADTTPAADGVSTAEATVMGEGQKAFKFTVIGRDGNEKAYEIHTDKETVGEALTSLGLIEGDEGPFGLYVKTVDGVTLDYDKDGAYWAFYEDGAYASAGVDTTAIREGVTYTFKAES